MTSQQDTELSRILDQFIKDLDYIIENTDEHPTNKPKAYAIQALTSWKDKEVKRAVYGFHEFIIGKNIIQKEEDQAFNYARLHRALDRYIKSLQSQGGKK